MRFKPHAYVWRGERYATRKRLQEAMRRRFGSGRVDFDRRHLLFASPDGHKRFVRAVTERDGCLETRIACEPLRGTHR